MQAMEWAYVPRLRSHSPTHPIFEMGDSFRSKALRSADGAGSMALSTTSWSSALAAAATPVADKAGEGAMDVTEAAEAMSSLTFSFGRRGRGGRGKVRGGRSRDSGCRVDCEHIKKDCPVLLPHKDTQTTDSNGEADSAAVSEKYQTSLSRGGAEARPCSFFASGKCRAGSDCRYFHGLQVDPGAASATARVAASGAHPREKREKRCPLCGYVTSSNGNLKRHMGKVHQCGVAGVENSMTM